LHSTGPKKRYYPTGFPRPSELFDNWAAVGLLIALGVIAVLLLRRRG
jgi:hypothetical protein